MKKRTTRMLLKSALFFAPGIWLCLEAHLAHSNLTPETSFREAKCGMQLMTVLEEWSSNRQWSQYFSRVDDAKVYRSPTSKIGVWIEVSLYPDKKIIASKVSSESFLHVSWDDSCTPQMGNEKRKLPKTLLPPGGSLMTDFELEKNLKSNPAGIIFAWSPFLPFSLEGFKEAQKLSQKLKIAFIPVMDPDADWKMAFEKLDKLKIPRSSAKRIDSLELIFRQLTLHYPSLLVFKQGKIVSSFLPGFENTLAYEKFILEHLKK